MHKDTHMFKKDLRLEENPKFSPLTGFEALCKHQVKTEAELEIT